MWYIFSVFSSSKCSLFHNSNVFGSCIIPILYTGVLKLKKNFGAERLNMLIWSDKYCCGLPRFCKTIEQCALLTPMYQKESMLSGWRPRSALQKKLFLLMLKYSNCRTVNCAVLSRG